MSPARISLALALLPHAGYTDPATAAQVRELLLAALGDHPLDAVAFPDVSTANAFELVNNVVIELLAETAEVIFSTLPAPSAPSDIDAQIAKAAESVFAPMIAELTAALAIDDIEDAESCQRRINDGNLDRLQYGSPCGVQWALQARRMIREHVAARRAKALGTVAA